MNKKSKRTNLAVMILTISYLLMKNASAAIDLISKVVNYNGKRVSQF